MICRTKQRLVLRKSSENDLKYHNNSIKIIENSFTYWSSNKNVKKVCFLYAVRSCCFFLFLFVYIILFTYRWLNLHITQPTQLSAGRKLYYVIYVLVAWFPYLAVS
jgi:preprotein translocase subunit SecY